MRSHLRITALPLVGILFASTALAAPLVARDTPQPVITQDFPDPSIIQVDDKWYAFATQGNGKKVQIAEANVGDTNSWKLLDEDALPNPGDWSLKTNIWAPQVLRVNDGSFVLYYAADVEKKGPGGQQLHCVGAATSNNIKGPYTAAKESIACPTDLGGAIDISGYIDSKGITVVTYKIDGNAIGLRQRFGPDGNILGDLSTPIVMQEMRIDGVHTKGDPVIVLDREDADGPLIEAPSLFQGNDGTYFLSFSSNMYDTDLYDTSYATSKDLFGPYVKTSVPLLESKTTGLYGPGGAEVDRSGKVMVYHGILEKKTDDQGRTTYLRRGMFTSDVATNDGRLFRTKDW